MFGVFIEHEENQAPRLKSFFSCSTQLSTKFQLFVSTKIQRKIFLAPSLSDVIFIMLINVKIPTVVGLSTFLSRINFVLSWVEHWKSFITSRPGFVTHVFKRYLSQNLAKVPKFSLCSLRPFQTSLHTIDDSYLLSQTMFLSHICDKEKHRLGCASVAFARCLWFSDIRIHVRYGVSK